MGLPNFQLLQTEPTRSILNLLRNKKLKPDQEEEIIYPKFWSEQTKTGNPPRITSVQRDPNALKRTWIPQPDRELTFLYVAQPDKTLSNRFLEFRACVHRSGPLFAFGNTGSDRPAGGNR